MPTHPDRAPHSALARCARGELPASVALMQLAMAAQNAEQVADSLCAARASFEKDGFADGAERLGKALDLWRAMPDAFPTITGVLRAVDHEAGAMTRADAIRYWAAAFDRAASLSPEASVALYSLGDRDLLDAVTNEVAARMADWDLLGPDRTLLDIGCGIGRFVPRLAAQVRFIVGIDISARMLQSARSRCAALGNVAFVRSSGCDLAAFADSRFDTIYAVDTFPYLVGSGTLADLHFHEAARLLKPGGRFLVINYSYSEPIETQQGKIAQHATMAGFAVLRNGTRDFSLWDGCTFLMQRMA